MTDKIAVLPGDYIGPEIMAEGIKSLDAVSEISGHEFELIYADFGGCAYDKYGHPFPEETKQICDEADSILKGPVGGPKYDKIPDINLRPERGAILPLRKRYDTFAIYRPVRLPDSLEAASPLKKERLGKGVDILMIREGIGGIYFGKKVEPEENKIDENGEWYAMDECKYTESQVERIAKVAFIEAEKIDAPLHNIHKSNVLATSRFWNQIVERVHTKEFPNVELEHLLVDATATYLITDPSQFKVMLLENMQGDILTDEGGGILGSLGLMPSACIGPKKSYFEASHGSAPKLKGKGIANPYAMIGSVAFMLEKDFDMKEESDSIWNALFSVFGKGYKTQELDTSNTPSNKILSTKKFGDVVSENILCEA